MFQPLTTRDATDPRWASGVDISMVPLRKVVGRSSQINNGWHRTNKHSAGFVGAESRPELAFFLVMAEMDPNITVITAQPCEIPFGHEGRSCSHFPDFAVLEAGESVLYEVKTERKYADAVIRGRLASAGRSIEARGWPYFVALAEEIRDDARFGNAEALWRRHRPIFNRLQRLAVEYALAGRERPIADVMAELAHRGDAAPTVEQVLSMAANGLIFVDLTRPIGKASLVRRADPQAMPEPLLPRRRPCEDMPEIQP